MVSRKFLAVGTAGALALGVAACGGDDNGGGGGGGSSNLSGKIAGAGSSAQEAAQEAWIANFQQSNPDVTISYDPVGSGGGVEQFEAGGVVYAGTDAPLSGSDISKSEDACSAGDLVEIPVYISPIAVIYNLPDVDKLQLDPETVAAIFNQQITKWNDPAIQKLNPGVDLPDTDVTPVNRSDDSGTTFNFTDYLEQAAGNAWGHPASETWPVKGGESAEGTSGVVQAVTAGEGAVGYADASQAGDLGIADIKVGNGYQAPSADAAAAVLDQSEVDKSLSKSDLMTVYSVNRNPSAGTYPIILVSYLLACTKYSSQTDGQIVGGFVDYVTSPEGQDAAAKNAGSAPISDAVRQQIQPAVDAVAAG